MRKTHEKTIDGIDYVMYEMNPFDASPLLTRILKLIGKPLAKIISSVKKEEGESILNANVNKELMGLAVEELTSNLSEKEVDKLIRDLLNKDLITFKNEDMEDFKKIANMKVHFGNLGLLHLYKVVRFSLEVNFSDFFAGLGELKE